METVQMNAIEIANELFETNHYQNMKKAELEKKAIEAVLKDRMGDSRREISKTHKVVMKFENNNTYLTDTEGLNDFLDSYGILTETVKFSPKNEDQSILDKIQGFKMDQEYYTKINVRLPKEEYDLIGKTTSELLVRWLEVTNQFNKLRDAYDLKREEMNNCKELAKTNKLKFEFGSISRIKKDIEYDVKAIQEAYGSEFVIKNAQPIMSRIEKYIVKGYFTIKEISEYKTLIKMGLKFTVTTLEKESELFNVLNSKRTRGSFNREKIKNQKSG